jgi:hypothetical protein
MTGLQILWCGTSRNPRLFQDDYVGSLKWFRRKAFAVEIVYGAPVVGEVAVRTGGGETPAVAA